MQIEHRSFMLPTHPLTTYWYVDMVHYQMGWCMSRIDTHWTTSMTLMHQSYIDSSKIWGVDLYQLSDSICESSSGMHYCHITWHALHIIHHHTRGTGMIWSCISITIHIIHTTWLIYVLINVCWLCQWIDFSILNQSVQYVQCINTAPSDYLKALMIHLSFLFLFLFQLLYEVVILFCINRIQLCCLIYSILFYTLL